MLSILFRFFGLFVLAWLFQRIMSFFLGASKNKRTKGNSASPSSHMVKDPICGMYMDARLAVRLDKKSEEFYFCSEECKQKYLSDPAASQSAGSAASR
jgi:uncharacterized protein